VPNTGTPHWNHEAATACGIRAHIDGAERQGKEGGAGEPIGGHPAMSARQGEGRAWGTRPAAPLSRYGADRHDAVRLGRQPRPVTPDGRPMPRIFPARERQKGHAKLGHKDLAGAAELPRKAGAKIGMKHMACFPVLKTTGNGHGQDNPASRRYDLRSRSCHLASAQVRQLACCRPTVFRVRNGGRCLHPGSDEET
jgi:hypothetical protein